MRMSPTENQPLDVRKATVVAEREIVTGRSPDAAGDRHSRGGEQSCVPCHGPKPEVGWSVHVIRQRASKMLPNWDSAPVLVRFPICRSLHLWHEQTTGIRHRFAGCLTRIPAAPAYRSVSTDRGLGRTRKGHLL